MLIINNSNDRGMNKAEEYIKAHMRSCNCTLILGGKQEWITIENALTAVKLSRDEMKEPVSNDLSDLIDKLSKRYPEVSFAKLSRIVVAATKWQIEQFEKNRLDACDRLTKEEYERESDFAIKLIEQEHRPPTFDDAIKYGIMMERERMMKNAIECEVHYAEVEGVELDTLQICPDGITLNSNDYKDGDKVKVIIIKE